MKTCAAIFAALSACAMAAEAEDPPFWGLKAQTARWLAHNLTYGVLSTTSTRTETLGQAFGNPYSFADGTSDSSTGNLYFYASDLDVSMIDLLTADNANPKASFTLSEAMIGGLASCENSAGGDPENPPCARLVMSGTFQNISGTDEGVTAKAALFDRHPSMAGWPSDHSWFVGKLDLEDLWLIDIYGGADDIAVSDYYSADISDFKLRA